MQKIYTHPSLLMVTHARNLLLQIGIDTQLRNEYAAGAAGELALSECWPELWLENHLFTRASAELQRLNTLPEHSWLCPHCAEQNHASFEVCWQCGAEAPTD